MAKELKFVAQQCMNEFYQNFRGDNEFWTIEDFIDDAGDVVAGIYQAIYQQQYQENRGIKKDELVTFDTSILSVQILDVTKDENGKYFASIKKPIMSFAYDTKDIGIQQVFLYEPNNGFLVERTTISELWQLQFAPKCNKVFGYVSSSGLTLINKSNCLNINKIQVYYVPEMNPNALVPDGFIDQVITKTVQGKRILADKVIVKKGLDENQNKILETEIDKNQLR